MDTIGIICEYNPFHNGHIYHLQKIKEMFPESLIILVMSGNFTQRGIPSIINKWDKTEIALKFGIDLVIELPFPFASQSADIFAHGAISILKELNTNYLVFGSESNNIDLLKKYANISLSKEYQEEVQKNINKGLNYPTALSNSFKPFIDNNIFLPNDLLGLSYIKEIMIQKANIKPISIQRTNNYHDLNINTSISSATSIRNGYINGNDISNVIPEIVLDKIKDSLFIQEEYFKYLKYKILTSKNLSIYQTVDEGIENRIKKVIVDCTTWDELVNKVKTKRYTYNKINRMFIHILCDFTKEEANKFKNISYIRVLGFSKSGQIYLNQLKKEVKLPIITTFSRSNDKMLELEMRTTSVYASVLDEDNKNKLIKQEYSNKPKMKV